MVDAPVCPLKASELDGPVCHLTESGICDAKTKYVLNQISRSDVVPDTLDDAFKLAPRVTAMKYLHDLGYSILAARNLIDEQIAFEENFLRFTTFVNPCKS